MKKINNNIDKLIIDNIKPNQLQDLKELQPIFDSRQSFYKKAHISKYNFGNNQTAIYLKSYETIVACIYMNQLRIYGAFSQTTARHIREFAKQNGFDDIITYEDMKNKSIFSK